jgi:hypothetical protein
MATRRHGDTIVADFSPYGTVSALSLSRLYGPRPSSRWAAESARASSPTRGNSHKNVPSLRNAATALLDCEPNGGCLAERRP